MSLFLSLKNIRTKRCDSGGLWCDERGGEKKGHRWTTVSLPQTHTHTQTPRHTLRWVPTDIWGFFVGLSILCVYCRSCTVFQSLIRLSRKQEILKTSKVSTRLNLETWMKSIIFRFIYSVVWKEYISAFWLQCKLPQGSYECRKIFMLILNLSEWKTFAVPIWSGTCHLLPTPRESRRSGMQQLFVWVKLFNSHAANKPHVKNSNPCIINAAFVIKPFLFNCKHLHEK